MRGRIFKNVLRVLIFSTLAFILVQSMLPPAASGAESGAVREFLAKIFPPSTPLGGFIFRNTRKIAHFAEYALLGTEVAVYVCIFSEKRLRVFALSLLFGFLPAFIDETVQVFSGRGASIADVWLDLFGYLFGSIVARAVFLIISKFKQGKINGKD